MRTAPSLAAWTLRRLLLALPVIAGVTTLTFVLIHVAPGDPIYLLAGDGGSPSYYADMRAKYGLDQGVVEQFVRYVAAVFSGDLGYSFMFQAPVGQVLLQHAPASALLGVTSLVLATAGGMLLGVWSAARGRPLVDALLNGVAAVLYAAPVFWTGQMLMVVFALWAGLLPVAGMSSAREPLSGVAYAADVLRHLTLPAVALAMPFTAVVLSVTRASMREALGEPFLRAAAARGNGQARLVWRHAVPNAAIPVAALIGQHAAGLAAGAALTEALFGWPGLGYLVLHASLHRDYPLVTGAFIFISAAVVVVNFATDAVCAWLDPRLRVQ